VSVLTFARASVTLQTVTATLHADRLKRAERVLVGVRVAG
jgi:hypothetical protein